MSRGVATAAGVVADRIFGEPTRVPHPVSLFGSAMRAVERRVYRPSRPSGLAYTTAGVALGGAAGLVTRSTALGTYVAVASRALGDAALAIGDALADDDLDRARELLPSLVGRDPSHLDEKEICRAVVESVAENTVDAVVAPMLAAAVAGAPGVLAYRAINTMDAMVGHRSERYERFGWSAARLDDIANWIPARVTAALVVAARPSKAADIIATVRRDASAHPSPNGGVAEAAFATALGLRLGGENRYGDRVELRPPLGDGRPADRTDIRPAVRLSRDSAALLAAGLALPGAARAARRWTKR